MSEKEKTAEYLRIAERTLRGCRQKGRINAKGGKPPQACVPGKHILCERSDLDEWVMTKASGQENLHRRTCTGVLSIKI